jgi:hypothetical protein
MKPAKILYFIEGVAPSPEDYEAASQLQATVVFRNALFVPTEPHSLEMCDGVAGEVPDIYAEAYPTAEDAIEKKAEELKALTSKVGDETAPKKKSSKKPQNQQPNPNGGGSWQPNQT